MKHIYMVHNGGEYSDYAVLGLFTDKALAKSFAKSSSGVVEAWEADIPAERWCHGSATLFAHKENGKWVVQVNSWVHTPTVGPAEHHVVIGYRAGWGCNSRQDRRGLNSSEYARHAANYNNYG
jgi:hypothetical protein